MKHHLYISPHLDDAVFSCGGCILQQTARGDRVTVLTVFAGDPPQDELSPFARQLHQRWKIGLDGTAVRRAEDRVACARLNATAVHLEYPEAIYRSSRGVYLYDSEEAIFGPVQDAEEALEEEILSALTQRTHPSMHVYAPMGLGGHVDHRMVRRVVHRLGLSLRLYQDFPYAVRGLELPPDLEFPRGSRERYSFQPEEVGEWASAICEYTTQLSTFWPSYKALMQELQAYLTEQAVMTIYRCE